ncbi:MAG: hypothetical protein QM679_10890 [Patulibacter sp.]
MSRRKRPALAPMASALVGGINELVVQAIVTGPTETPSVEIWPL